MGADMRAMITIVEGKKVARTVNYFLHVTKRANLKSILKNGLIPNFAGGNYSDTRWISLEGVYASREMDQLKTYLRAHDTKDFAILVIGIEEGSSLPDEDIVEIILQKAYEQAKTKTNINPFEEDEIESDDPFWKVVANNFHFLASSGQRCRKDMKFLTELVDWWADFEHYQGGDVGPDEWAAMKDRAVRAYPKMVNPHLGYQHSVRIPGTVGFEGSARIVAAIDVNGMREKLVFGAIPEEAQDMVAALVNSR